MRLCHTKINPVEVTCKLPSGTVTLFRCQKGLSNLKAIIGQLGYIGEIKLEHLALGAVEKDTSRGWRELCEGEIPAAEGVDLWAGGGRLATSKELHGQRHSAGYCHLKPLVASSQHILFLELSLLSSQNTSHYTSHYQHPFPTWPSSTWWLINASLRAPFA